MNFDISSISSVSFVPDFYSMLFLCFMVGMAGFIDAAAGGGGLISLPSYLFIGMPPHLALGCNKFSGACGTTLAVIRFWKNGSVDIKAALIAAVFSFAGSALGSKTALILSPHLLKTILIAALPFAALFISLKHNFGEEDLSSLQNRTAAAVTAAVIGFIIGGYDGLIGPGTGIFAIIAFSALMKYDLKTSSGNAKILNLASNYASVIVFAASGTIIYKIAIPAAVCGIVGNYFGSGFALAKGAKFIRPMMMFVLLLLLAKIACDLYGM